MHKLSLVLVLFGWVIGVYAGVLELGSADSGISVSQVSPAEISVDLGIREIGLDASGICRLPLELAEYRRSGDPSGGMVVHLAIAESGDYAFRISGEPVATGITAATFRGNGMPVVSLSKPYWFRDVRGLDLLIDPVREMDGELVVYDKLRIDIYKEDGQRSDKSGNLNARLNPYFFELYKHHFANFTYRYEDIGDCGSMAVFCPSRGTYHQYDQFYDLIQPWVDWKNQTGIRTTVYFTDSTLDTYEEILARIRVLYAQDPDLTFVQIIGDYAQVPCNVATIYGNNGGMDPFYSLVHGDDPYPDIFVGRWSAETAADLYTQVKRSLEYEKGMSSGDWLHHAAGVCSSNPPLPGDDDEHNWEHLDSLRTELLDYGYTSVDRIYGNEGASTQDLIDCLNAGRSLVNYCGEGYPTHLVEPEFWISDVASLNNEGRLPFIHAVSCWIGQFYNGTCLAEALMRGSDPTAENACGAIAIYAAAPEQGIAPPMEAQDHAMELLTSGSKSTIGGICYNGSCSMIDAYGEYGEYNFLAWNLFGDASLMLRTRPSLPINAVLPLYLSAGSTTVNIDAGEADIRVALSRDDLSIYSAFSGSDGIARLVTNTGLSPNAQYLLTLTGKDRTPIQRYLNCNYGGSELAVLDLTVLDSDQFIEPETEITKTIRITNLSTIPANAVHVRLVPGLDTFNVTPVIADQHIPQILPGEARDVVLSYIVHKGIPDMTIVNYRILAAPNAGAFPCSDVVHAPRISIDALTRSPQINWINPGDEFTATYRFSNRGSTTLREMSGVFSSDSDHLSIISQDNRTFTLQPGDSDSLVVRVSLAAGCPVDLPVSAEMSFDAFNAFEIDYQEWLVSAPTQVVESFETQDLQSFPWQYQAEQWQLHDHGYDGKHSLLSRRVAADSVWLELTVYNVVPGTLGFRYSLINESDSADRWFLRINGSPKADLASSSGWAISRYPLEQGINVLRWVGLRDESQAAMHSDILLDEIQFPYGTIFENAHLAGNTESIRIILAPGEVRTIPLDVSSADGKYIRYSAVLEKADSAESKSDEIRITCNKASFHAGAEEMFLFTLYNPDQELVVNSIELTLPEGVLAQQVTPFSMLGQTSLSYAGFCGDIHFLRWTHQTGSGADSLRAGLRLAIDANQTTARIPYRISGYDLSHPVEYAGEITMQSADSLVSPIRLDCAEGELQDRETGVISLRANQNILGTEPASYNLAIYYNGFKRLDIPIEIDYDAEPAGFYDTMRLSNYPNPCASGTTFAYAVPADGKTELAIYNLRGQKVQTIVRTELAKGYYRTAWDGKDTCGNRLAGGVYFCRLRAVNGKQITIKFTVL